MPITYPLTFPSQGLVDVVFGMRSIVAVTRSPFTGQEQVQKHQGHLWEASVNYPAMKRENAEQVIAFLAKLNGREGTFLMGDPNGATPRGSASSTPGTPIIDGASQTGVDLNIDGLPVGVSGYLLTGDYIGLGTGSSTRFHKVLDDVNTDSVGAATLTIWPELRSSPSDGATVIVSSAVCLFRLASNLSNFSIDVATFYGLSFAAVESP